MKKVMIGLIIGVLLGASTNAFAAIGDSVQAVFASFSYVVNGSAKAVDSPVLVYEGTSYIRTTDMANMLGYDVTYKSDSRTIEFNKPESTPQPASTTQAPAPSVNPSPTPSPTPSSSPSGTTTETPNASPSPTPNASPAPSATPSPSPTPIPSASPTPTPAPTPDPVVIPPAPPRPMTTEELQHYNACKTYTDSVSVQMSCQ